MAEPANNEEFLVSLRALIDLWCERKALLPLARILGPYVAFHGLTDDWHALETQLKAIRAMDRDHVTPSDLETINDLIRAVDKAIVRL
jgi:hypothetical protein